MWVGSRYKRTRHLVERDENMGQVAKGEVSALKTVRRLEDWEDRGCSGHDDVVDLHPTE
jgi:hypothetical protein